MIKLDENLLVELGLGSLPKEEKTAFLKHMYETLEMRVGTRLAERMSDQQMTEFEQFINSNDEQGAFHWLESNFPNYKDVVAEEFEKLKGEVRPMSAQIVAASQAQDAQLTRGQPESVMATPAQATDPWPAAPAMPPTSNNLGSVNPISPPAAASQQGYGALTQPQAQQPFQSAQPQVAHQQVYNPSDPNGLYNSSVSPADNFKPVDAAPDQGFGVAPTSSPTAYDQAPTRNATYPGPTTPMDATVGPTSPAFGQQPSVPESPQFAPQTTQGASSYPTPPPMPPASPQQTGPATDLSAIQPVAQQLSQQMPPTYPTPPAYPEPPRPASPPNSTQAQPSQDHQFDSEDSTGRFNHQPPPQWQPPEPGHHPQYPEQGGNQQSSQGQQNLPQH